MILKALYDLAQQEGLADDLDFEMRPVRFMIVLGADGTAHLKDTAVMEASKDGKGKPRLHIPPLKIPRQSGRTSGDNAEFLVDKCDYVFGSNPSLPGERTSRLPERAKLFLIQVEKLSSYPKLNSDEQKSVSALLDFLKQPQDKREAILLERWEKAATGAERINLTSALFAFEFDPLGSTPLHLLPGIVTYWRKSREANETSILPKAVCLVTGKLALPIDKHPPIKKVPGGNTSGAALISFNTDAYESFGLSRNENAPISREAAEACANGLNRLLNPNSVNLQGVPLPRRNLKLSDNTVALFWAKGDSNLDWILGGLETDTPDTVKEMLTTPQKGKKAPLQDENAFFTLILSGSQGRSIVRSFLETSTKEAAQAMADYLNEVSILLPFGRGVSTFPLREYLRSLVPQQKLKNLPPHLASEIYICALFQRPYPRQVLESAIRRNRVEGPLTRTNWNSKPTEIYFGARCSLIKAYLIRNQKWEVNVSLDLKNRQPSYLLGRLLATLDKVQQEALGDINATIVDRYYGSASSTPAAVFPTLIRRSQHHLGKLGREKPGQAINREKLIQEITADLNDFRKTLTLEEQGLFALGFYHQRRDFFQKKEEK